MAESRVVSDSESENVDLEREETRGGCTATLEEKSADAGAVATDLGSTATNSTDILVPPAPADPADSEDDGDGESTKVWYVCVYQCGPRRPRSQFTPKGRKGSAVMVCYPCYAALKSLENSYSKTQESKALLSRFRKNTEAFAALIRRTRIRKDPNEIGLDSKNERRQAFFEARSLMEQFLEISERWTALWLTEKRYIAHQIFHEGIEGDTLGECRKAARLKWNEDIKRAKTRTRNGELEIACDSAPQVVATRGRRTSAQVSGTRGVESIADMESELGKMATHGVRSSDFMSPAMGGVGEIFRTGNLASSSSAGNPPLPGTELLPATTAEIGGSEAFQEPSAFEEEDDLVKELTAGKGKKRKLGRHGTDGDGEVLGGVCGSVLAKQKEAEEDRKAVFSDYGSAKNNQQKIAAAMLDKFGEHFGDTQTKW